MYGLTLASSSYCTINNITSYNNNRGLALGSNSGYNNVSNVFSYNNSGEGLYLLGINNIFLNQTIYNNGNAIYMIGNSVNNTFLNSTILNSTGSYNIYFVGLGGNWPTNNTFYNNNLGNKSKIDYNNWTNINYFNSSLSGYNIGNWWNDFPTCSSTETRGPYAVCTNPANYSINSTNNIYDFAPLAVPIDPYAISSCSNLSIAGGSYYLTANIINSAVSKCINISVNNVTFDCMGYTIDGNDVANNGIYLYRSSAETTNVTIKNCIVSDFTSQNIYISNGDKNILLNITSNSSSGYGINLDYSSNNSISSIDSNSNSNGIRMLYGNYNNFNNLNISKNTQNGIYLFNGLYNNFYNSTFFNNTAGEIYIPSNTNSYCNNYFSNITDPYGKYIIYSNSSININGWTNISSIFLCNADYSTIQNLNYVSNYNSKGYFIYILRTDYSNFTNLNGSNYYSGIAIYDSSNNLLNNINTSNAGTGISLTSPSNNNILNNIISYNNTYGFYFFSGPTNNTIANILVYNNSQAGIQLSSDSYNNTFINFNSSNNFDGIRVIGKAINNTFLNGTSLNNTNYNLYFLNYVSYWPYNNTFYNNYLGNISKINSLNWSNVNYFNSSLSGYNIGNYWNDFPACSSTEIRGDYKVCTNPANYTLNSTNNIYDFAPLIIAPEYISPTPANNSNIGALDFTISIQDTQGVSSWFNVTINGVSYAMVNTSSTVYEYTLTNGFNSITDVTFNVSYEGGGTLETRVFTYYPDYTDSVLSSYGIVSFFISLVSILFLFFNLNFRKNNSKKSIIEVIAIVTLLLVVVTAGIFVNSWYQDFSTSYQTKKLTSSATSANSFEVVAIKNESSILSVYLKSKSAGYSIIERISVNSVDCTIVQDNVILGNSITPIEVQCSSVDTVNNYIVIYSKKAVFSANVPLIS